MTTQQPGALTNISFRLIFTSWKMQVKTTHVGDEGCQLLTPLLHFIIMPNNGAGGMFKQKSATCCNLLPNQVFDKQHESLQLPSATQNFAAGHVQGIKVEPTSRISAWWTNHQKLRWIQPISSSLTQSRLALTVKSHPFNTSKDMPLSPIFSTSGVNLGGLNTSATAYLFPSLGDLS